MVARKFLVRHDDSTFSVDYDTDDGFEVFQFQLFSLTSIPPDEQEIAGEEDDATLLKEDVIEQPHPLEHSWTFWFDNPQAKLHFPNHRTTLEPLQ
ncbi:peptide-N(4)-(N-acetyl-beta-glucosaminyl)asparagine amidase-like [Hibiscus syriacus]|uniref:peptide-N(4)-(N-acetyl-beta- glucosaminyl)asparagine amidase-like n=1 Tax=Hibiscus syriacus TaxID=106335 RepID=UPI00192416F8|nr:peptide-N(4)-(N-acetyl-beta-glucosaminyl)asparagine amidase-like [Hibiscus syriacus]